MIAGAEIGMDQRGHGAELCAARGMASRASPKQPIVGRDAVGMGPTLRSKT